MNRKVVEGIMGQFFFSSLILFCPTSLLQAVYLLVASDKVKFKHNFEKCLECITALLGEI